ncbi:hypothetical protein FPQ18DRAFT_303050 [Pyronema domesticum]|nr:hypothetical protein FPQ18DRAFT_303050 [Pyronema domesticum]
MEGLGIAANFIAVINQTVILSEAIYKYVQSIRRRRKIAQAFGEEVMLFLGALQKLEDVVKRVEKERIRTDNLPLNEDSFMNATAACKRTLLEILNKLPEKRTVNLPLLGKVKVALKWPFDEKEMDATLKKLQGHQQSFVIQLGARTLDEALDTKMMVKRVGSKIDKLDEKTDDVKVVVTELRDDNTKRREEDVIATKKRRLDKLIRWLAPTQYSIKQEESLEKHQAGTGKWLFDHAKYRKWRESSTSALWVHGIAGSLVIESFENGWGDNFAYFYFQYNREETKDPTIVLRTILAQLLHGYGPDILGHPSIAALESEKVIKNRGPPVAMQRLEDLLYAVLELHKQAPTILLDGLDEYPLERRKKLLDLITSVTRRSRLRIMIFSREEEDIKDSFRDFNVISLGEEGINLKEDMRKHIEAKFEDPTIWSGAVVQIQGEITERLIECSGRNTFRWLDCQLDLLHRHRTVVSIRKTLESVPHTLFETYDRILEYIDIEPYADLICNVILITTHAWGPIDLEMMNEAISIITEENKLDRYYSFGNPKDILEICRGLICMHPSSTFEEGPDIGSTQGVIFSHYTVREYFESEYLIKHPRFSKYSIQNSENRMCKLTLRYLTLEDFKTPCLSEVEIRERLENHKFYKYCAFFWLYHLRRIVKEIYPVDEGLFELVDKFIFDSPGNLHSYEQVLATWWAEDPTNKRMWEINKFSYNKAHETHSMLSNAIFYQLFRRSVGPEWLFKCIFDKRPGLIDVDIRGLGPPIWIALTTGRKDLHRCLIEKGANLRTVACPEFPFIPEAGHPIDSHFDALLKLHVLPQTLFVPAEQFYSKQYPIHKVAVCDPDFLSVYIDKGIDVNTRSEDGTSPIHYAVMCNNLEAVKLLVSFGADINCKTNAGRTPLHIAISIYSAPIVDYLLQNGAILPPDLIGSDIAAVAHYKPKLPRRQEYDSTPNDRLLERMNDFPIMRKSENDIPNTWLKQVISWNESDTTERCHGKSSCYLSIDSPFRSLQRIEFRIRSKEKWAKYNPRCGHHQYVWKRSWFEASVRKKNTDNQSTTRFVQLNVNSFDLIQYHSVTWDIRDQTPGVKEWLEEISDGDIIDICGASVEGCSIVLEELEAHLYGL